MPARGAPRRSATPWSTARCWCRRRGSGYATALACERCRTPARCARLPGPLALASADRAADLPLVRHRPPRRGPARSAATAGCARRCSATPAPPRSSAARSPAPSVRTLRRRPGAGRRSTTEPRDRRRHARAPSRSPTGGYAAVVLLDTWLLLGLARPARRGGGAAPLGQRRRRWSAPAAARWRSATRPTPPSRRWCAGTRPGSPPARPTQRREAHLPPATRLATITGEPGRRRRRAHPARRRPPAPRCSARSPSARTGVPRRRPGAARARRRALRAPCGELQRVRSARKLDAVRIQVDPPTL